MGIDYECTRKMNFCNSKQTILQIRVIVVVAGFGLMLGGISQACKGQFYF